ncbi:MAG TPA: hypothetical protein VFL27_14390 [Candidatus Dormibacteraeota bacterium]|nr:hypothetical protein [Candidatus Dormibacteraeota bacterium]
MQHRQLPLGDYANQSIACVVLGVLCGVAFVLGLIAGYLAYRDLPRKRTQAVVGMVLNTIGIGVWILILAARFAR